jgi:XTP/dITP diphosphohydrolase
MKPKLLVATRSDGKQREIRQLMADASWSVVFPDERGLYHSPEEEGIETAGNFEGNARRKAEYFARLARMPTLAEDSGLEVLALGGAPGVNSRRFAYPLHPDPKAQDAANNAELLRRLSGAPDERRRARYRCAVVYLDRWDGVPRSFEGTCQGRVLAAPAGTGGFGYDPIFFSDELGKSFGEATPEEKAGVSHRGRAFRAFLEWVDTHPPGR